jgi:regulatory protein
MQLLSRRDYAAAELEAKLLSRGFEPAAVAAALERLGAERLLNDGRFLEEFIGSRARRGQGPAKIRMQLRGRGLDAALIDEHLARYPHWADEARRIKQKKFGATAPTQYADKARQARFLQSRGFSGAHIRHALGTDLDLDDT